MEQERSPRWVVALILLVVALGFGACRQTPPPQTSIGPRPECPESGDWSGYFDSVIVSGARQLQTGDRKPPVATAPIAKAITKAGTKRGDLSVSQMITNIPEFHDCQQFVELDSAKQQHFTSLFAIFARFRLDTVSVDSSLPFPGDSTRRYDDRRQAPPGDKREPAAKDDRREPAAKDGKREGPASNDGRNVDAQTDKRESTGQKGTNRRAASVDPRWVSEQVGISMAEIYSYEVPYKPLGIEKNFNCLYIYPKSGEPDGLEAKVVPVGLVDSLCTLSKMPSGPGTVLAVSRHSMSGGKADDYPPVARWDWDSTHSTHYIGIRCGDAWCEVGPKYLAPDALVSSVWQKERLGASKAQRHVSEVKGWYDEQRLALPAPGSPSSLQVSSLVGTLKPDPNLGNINGMPHDSGFTNRWQPVATVTIRPVRGVFDKAALLYRRKLNLEPGSGADTTNQVSMCFDPTASQAPNSCVLASVPKPPKCTNEKYDGWWARIESAKSHETKYYCVIRRGHEDVAMPGFTIPGIVRWRWAIKDETIWARCLQGCCEVDSDT